MPTRTEQLLANRIAVELVKSDYADFYDEVLEYVHELPFSEKDMITFLPSSDFAECARVLDNKRLGKQRIEAFQIITTLCGTGGGWGTGWGNHPATLMWEGHVSLLCEYYNWMVKTWIARGFLHSPRFKPFLINAKGPYLAEYRYTFGPRLHPPWLCMPELHASHRAALLAKDPEHYGQFNWKETPRIEYVWPVRKHLTG